MGTTPARQRGQCSFCIRALVEPSLQVRGARAFLVMASRPAKDLLFDGNVVYRWNTDGIRSPPILLY